MKFEQYGLLCQRLLDNVIAATAAGKEPQPTPLALAYLGDAVFSLYVRERLLLVERNKVRVLNDISAKAVSAVHQARALEAILPLLNEEEAGVVRRGRNTKSSVPKSASMREYRQSTGLECLLGWLYWHERAERLYLLMDRAFAAVIHSIQENGETKA